MVEEQGESLRSALRAKQITNLLCSLEKDSIRYSQLEEKYMLASGYPGLLEQQQALLNIYQRFEQIDTK